jgi:hypothetical protein
MLFLQYQSSPGITELLIIIHFGFKGHGHLLMSFFSGKTSLFVGGSLSAGSRQQAAGSRQQAAGSRWADIRISNLASYSMLGPRTSQNSVARP